MAILVYPSDLNEEEWALLAPLIPTSKPNGRPRSSDMRRITNDTPSDDPGGACAAIHREAVGGDPR